MPSRNHLPNYLLVDYSLCLFAFIFEYLIALHFWKLMVALPDKLIHYCNDVPESPIQVTELATSFFPPMQLKPSLKGGQTPPLSQLSHNIQLLVCLLQSPYSSLKVTLRYADSPLGNVNIKPSCSCVSMIARRGLCGGKRVCENFHIKSIIRSRFFTPTSLMKNVQRHIHYFIELTECDKRRAAATEGREAALQ